MKKIIVFMMLVCCIIGLGYGQEKQEETAEEITVEDVLWADGYVWNSMKIRYKYVCAAALLCGYVSASVIIYERYGEKSEEITFLIRLFLIKTSIKEAVGLIDLYYASTGQLDDPIWMVLLHMYGRNWWKIEEDEEQVVVKKQSPGTILKLCR